jgi:class 3 adenylate cyclase/tetratricopeptide (TPR) repeat protein
VENEKKAPEALHVLDPELVTSSRRPARRRYVTVLFSDVVGSSEYAQTIEAEDYAAVLEKFRHFVRTVIERHGGVVARMQGDGALALFGHLEEREDDGRRATEAALELHAVTAALRVGHSPTSQALQLRSGIHAGLVLVLEGDIERGRFDVVGEVPNTAARVVGLAAPNEVLVSAETLGPYANFYELTLLRQLPIRGRSRPLDVLRIAGHRNVQRRIDADAGRGMANFVGRQSELDALEQAAARARSETRIVLVVGEPGVGKTRLTEEFERRFQAEGCVLHGFCESYLAAEPLQPFLHWGRAALGWRVDATPEANDAAVLASLDALGRLLDTDARSVACEMVMGRGVRGMQGSAALIALLVALAARSPLLLVLDDWQWADDATRLAVAELRKRQIPSLLIVISRPMDTAQEEELASEQVLRLQPMPNGEAEDAINAWLPGVDPFVSQEILRQSGGTPLLIEELCLAVRNDRTTLLASGHVGLAWLDGMVASRLAFLERAQADCLEVAAVVGSVFAVWLLESLVEDAQPLLATLERLEFIASASQPGMLKFRHVLTRDAVYATVESARRRELHRQVAESLELAVASGDVGEHLEAMAYHFEASGQNPKAALYSEAAGDKALAAMALDRARAHYLSALRSLDGLPSLSRETQLRWCAIAQRLGQTCVFDPLDVSHGLQMFARAVDLARLTGDVNAIARAEYWLGYVNYGKGHPRAAVRHCEAALDSALASEDSRLIAQVQATLGQSLASAGDYARALPLLRQAVESKRQQGRPNRSQAIGSAYTLGRIGYTLGDLGRFEEAYAQFDQALDLLGDPLHSVGASVRELRCAVLLWQGRWEDARQAGLEGADIALRCRSRYLTAMGRALGACGIWAIERNVQALRALRDPTQWIEASGGAVSTSINYGWLVDACAELGLVDEMRQHFGRLLARARVGDRHGLAMGLRAVARWMAATGTSLARVERQLALADRMSAVRDSLREAAVGRLARAEVAALVGSASLVRQEAESALVAFESMRMTSYSVQAQALLETV